MSQGIQEFLKEGATHLSGVAEVAVRNIAATKKLSDLTRTSLGPNGMNKMIINHLEKLFVTSDAATIMKELDVVHPAAKVIVLNAAQQENEIGDATNLVVILAGELLQKAESLLRQGLHPAEIVDGYSKSLTRALEILDELCTFTVNDVRDVGAVTQVLRSAIGSKQHGYEDVLAPLVADACIRALPTTGGPAAFNVDNVRVVKVPGGSVNDASIVQGVVMTRGPEGTVRHCLNAKIAVYAGAIDAAKTETKGTVLISNADELLQFSTGEEKQMEKLVDEIAAAGVGVVIAGGNVGELAMHYLERKGILVAKAPSKFDIRRLCSAVGATPLVRMGAPTAEEMGRCRAVTAGEIGSQKVTYFRNDDGSSKIATIVVRGSTANLLDNVERAIDDGVNVFKLLCRNGRCVAGGGATELELARRLAREAGQAPGLAQYAMQRFAESLEVVAATLAETCGIDSTKVVSDLYAAHELAPPTTPGARGAGSPTVVGVDVAAGTLGDMAVANVWDVLNAKRSAIHLAADAAMTILKVDQIIMARRAGGPKAPQQGARDADD